MAQLRVLDDLSRRLEEEVCAERTRCEGVEELLQIERVRAPIPVPLPAHQQCAHTRPSAARVPQKLAESAADMHAEQLAEQRRLAAAERESRLRAEAALAKCMAERKLGQSQLQEAQSEAQRWEAECGRARAEADQGLAKVRATLHVPEATSSCR